MKKHERHTSFSSFLQMWSWWGVSSVSVNSAFDIAHPRLPSLVSVLFLGTDSPAAEASFIEEPLLTVVETSHSDCSNMKLTSLLNIQQQPNPKVNPKNVWKHLRLKNNILYICMVVRTIPRCSMQTTVTINSFVATLKIFFSITNSYSNDLFLSTFLSTLPHSLWWGTRQLTVSWCVFFSPAASTQSRHRNKHDHTDRKNKQTNKWLYFILMQLL